MKILKIKNIYWYVWQSQMCQLIWDVGRRKQIKKKKSQNFKLFYM